MQTNSIELMRRASPSGLTFLLGIAFAGIWPKFVARQTSSSPSLPHIDDVDILSNLSQQTLLITAGAALVVVALIIFARKYLTISAVAEHAAPDQASAARTRLQEAVLPAADQSAEIEKVRAHVEQQLGDLIGFVSRYLETTNGQASTYVRAQSSLAAANTIEQVQAVIKILVASSAQARRDADQLRSHLEESQEQSALMRQRLAEAETRATVDALTELPNRRRLQELLEQEVAVSHAENTPLSLIMVDIDLFKSINDKFGHLSGDAVLKRFARHLSEGAQSTGFVARYGGEEFAIVLPKTPLGNASHIAEGLRRGMSEFRWYGNPASRLIGKVTASFGIAEIRETETPEQLVERADRKLYVAKRNGRNRVEIDHGRSQPDAETK